MTIPCTDELLMPPLVEAELGHAWARRKLEYLKGVCLSVLEPSKAFLEAVKAKSQESGDDARLSEADLQALALALETGATLLTDDYSIQNVARQLSIPYRPVSQKGIRQVLIWNYKCRGCGRVFEEAAVECPVCGSEVRSHRPNNKRKGSREQATGSGKSRRPQ